MTRTYQNAKLRRSSTAKPNLKTKIVKRAATKTKRDGQKKTSTPIAPNWAQASVFTQARIIAWEGTTEPLHALKLFPLKGTFLDAILLTRKGTKIQWSESIHPLDQVRVKKAFEHLAPLPCDIEYRLLDTNGESIWVRHSILETSTQKNLRIAKGFVRNIQTEKELEIESLRISEREQNRIGQDLHDDLCQVLAGVSCLMRVAEGRLASKVPEEVASISELNQQIIDAMHRTRALTHGLFPGKIQIADIRGALLELASQVRTRFQVEVKTEFAGRFPHHTNNQIIQIYRLTQEAISNAIKHGNATCIEVRLEARHANMFLSVIDNGTGLNQTEPTEKGVGHHIMQSRTSTIGGQLDIRNAPNRGVAVTLTYPFLH